MFPKSARFCVTATSFSYTVHKSRISSVFRRAYPISAKFSVADKFFSAGIPCFETESSTLATAVLNADSDPLLAISRLINPNHAPNPFGSRFFNAALVAITDSINDDLSASFSCILGLIMEIMLNASIYLDSNSLPRINLATFSVYEGCLSPDKFNMPLKFFSTTADSRLSRLTLPSR